MSSSKSRRRRSDSSNSTDSSSESGSSVSSKHYKKRKHSDTFSSSDSDNGKAKIKKEYKEKSGSKHDTKCEPSDKDRRGRKDHKVADHKENERRRSTSRYDKTRRSIERAERQRSNDRADKYRHEHRDDKHRNDHRENRYRNGNKGDDQRKKDFRDRPGRYMNERDRNYSGGRRKSPARFRGRRNNRSRSKSFDHANAKWGKGEGNSTNEKSNGEKQKPNFALSGKLTEETNTYRGVVVKYSEPPEARKPKRRWRLYPFKGEKPLPTLYIHRESAYLIGRDRKVVDLPVDHPSCSKQHAALQYRLVSFTRDDGSSGRRIRPYLIDLESANGTFINNKKIEPKKYVELLERDVIKFGFSSREYVLLHENSKEDAQDDDVKMEEEDVKIKKEEQET